MIVDYAAIAPELALTAVLCVVLVADLFLPEDAKRWVMPLAFLGVVGTLGTLLMLAGGPVRSTLGGMFVLDSFALLFKAIFCIAALIIFAISHDYLQDDDIHQGEYYTLMLCSLLGMLTIASSRDLIPIFVSLELISLPSFILAGLRKSDLKSNEAALKFFLFGVLSTTVMLYGMSLIYGITGATNLSEISSVLQANPVEPPIAILSVFFIVVGFGFKVSAFPFQWWVPDTYEGSPVPVAAFLSVASKTAGFVGLLQIMFIAFTGFADIWRPFFGLIAILTMTFGNLVAMQQTHIIRLLAYSSIGQAGYILLPLGVASSSNLALNQQAFQASAMYLLIYAFMETGVFAVAIAIGRRGGGYHLDNYSGLFHRSPGLAWAMALFLASLAGVPPVAGWAAKFFVFSVVINGGGLGLAIAMGINTVFAAFYYAAIFKKMFFEKQRSGVPGQLVPPLLGTAIGLTAGVTLIVGILPDLFGRLARVSTFF